MKNLSVAVIGGGPAGLLTARLVKRDDPTADVVVYERNGTDTATFGFGVGLTEATMANVHRADPEAAQAIRDASWAGHDLRLRHVDGDVTRDVALHGARNLAIGRATLLAVLEKLAADSGVEIRHGAHVTAADLDADVIVAADGVRSSTRAAVADEVGFTEDIGRGLYMWCGLDVAIHDAFFSARWRDDALFVTHAYPYDENRSTFLLETDDESFAAAGLGEFDALTPAGETDRQSIALLEDVFADDLENRGLLHNRSRWSRFSTVSLQRWSTRNIVFVGDTAHTAHYTLGSGTKLALEDAIALASALRDIDDRDEAFASYEASRRPAVERFKHLAHRSQRWWESYRYRVTASPEHIALSYMTRAGNLSVVDFARSEPATAAVALSALGSAPPADPADLIDWILDRAAPLDPAADIAVVEWSEPDAWSKAADALVVGLQSDIVRLTGPDDGLSVDARIDLGERIKLTSDRQVFVELPSHSRPAAASAVAAGRCDGVVFTA
ncbi:FAD-dependent monooxygenase [Gordonia sihwensis]|uniref:FAD-dependent monooxygenase n=1 Tax=Gordonia sihwensis TaxID=173559 RepID=UPI003D977BE1